MADTGIKGIDRNLTRYGDTEFSRYLRRAFLSSAGYDGEDLNRPIIGVADTSSDYNTCHRDMPALVEGVRRGITQADGLALAFPTLSLAETLLSPTSMLFRNLMAMGTEEMIQFAADGRRRAGGGLRQDRAGPVDGCRFGWPAGHLAGDRRHAHGELAGRASRRLHGLPAVLAAAQGGRDRPGGDQPKSSSPCAPRAERAWSWARPPPWPA